MLDAIVLSILGLIILFSAMATNFAQDIAFQVQAIVVLAAAGLTFLWKLRSVGEPAPAVATGYMDGVVRAGVIATALWGIVGFLAGTYIAFQLAFPILNLDLPFTTFGRLRPLHTSAVIFAFGGNALIATSFYVVQRTSAARLWGGNLAWFVFWGYQLFIVLAALGYVLGGTQSKEYAEPEWHVDIWLTIVWLAYLAVFLGTILKRKEPHIYVANWFYLSFIVTVAMLHLVNNISIPVSILGLEIGATFRRCAGCADAVVVWPQRGRILPDRGLFGHDVLLHPKRAERPVYSYKLSIIHFWALIFLYIWAGPHHLHYTALPDWAQTLGMVFSVVLWMPSLGRHDQRPDDAIGRMGQTPHRSSSPDDGRFRGFLRHGDIRRANDGDQGRQFAQPLHRLDHRSRSFRCAWAGTA